MIKSHLFNFSTQSFGIFVTSVPAVTKIFFLPTNCISLGKQIWINKSGCESTFVTKYLSKSSTSLVVELFQDIENNLTSYCGKDLIKVLMKSLDLYPYPLLDLYALDIKTFNILLS